MRSLIKNSFLWTWLQPGFPDAARLIAQTPVLHETLEGRRFSGRCLNAGCGEGLYWEFLESFHEIVRIDDIDISAPGPEKVAGRRPEHHVVAGSLTELPYPDASFESCLCTEVIEHIPDHAKAAAELARVLKPGGLLLASVPQTPAPWDPNHARQGYTVGEFRGLLEGAGFEVVAHRSCFFGFMRAIMHYWRKPLIRVGGAKTPYIPKLMLSGLVALDRAVRPGKPWDLVVCAIRRR